MWVLFVNRLSSYGFTPTIDYGTLILSAWASAIAAPTVEYHGASVQANGARGQAQLCGVRRGGCILRRGVRRGASEQGQVIAAGPYGLLFGFHSVISLYSSDRNQSII